MMQDFNYIPSVYWVFTQLCNDTCSHCYNLSGPRGERMSLEDCLKIVQHLPDQIDRLILSGGEPLAEKQLLYEILKAIQEKYGDTTRVMLQTNGDLLTDKILDKLLSLGVCRFDIASIDRYHTHKNNHLSNLRSIFQKRNIPCDNDDNTSYFLQEDIISWGYWGATEDLWLGGNWARGRALETNTWTQNPAHNFCAIHSGARNFLGGHDDVTQEISIQLWKINPCCPGTKYPMGDARKEKISEILSKVSSHPVFMALNDGEPLKMGEHLGVSPIEAEKQTEELKNICLYCDQFFTNHMSEWNTDSFIPLPVI
jgi:organic radical activating enzyme